MKATNQRGGGKGRGVHRMTSRYFRRLTGRMVKYRRLHPKPISVFGICDRCKCQFVPDWMDGLSKFSNCCSRCQVKNLADSLGLPALREFAGIPRNEP